MNGNESVIIFKFVKEDESDFTILEFKYVICKIDSIVNKILLEQNICSKSELNDYSPKITKVNEGCIEFSTIVSSVISGIITECIMKIFEKVFHKIKGKVTKHEDNVTVINIIKISEKIKWKFDDDYFICDEVIKCYVIKKSNEDVSKFVNTCLINLVKKFGYSSVEHKVKNIKCLLDNNGISNSLKCSKLKHYSKQNEEAFNKARKVYSV